MAGRPRSKLKRVNELLERAADYGDALFDLMPAQHLQRPDPDDAICVAWHHARNAAMENYRALNAVRELIATKVERADGVSATGQGRER